MHVHIFYLHFCALAEILEPNIEHAVNDGLGKAAAEVGNHPIEMRGVADTEIIT